MADPPAKPPNDDHVLSRLWEIAHKYQRCLRQGQVVPLAESEGDRQTVAPFAESLRNSTERNLDGMTYRSLAEMQVRRDTRRLLSNLPGSVRLRRLGFEVAVRAKPIAFAHAPASLLTAGLLASVSYQTEQVEAVGEAAETLEELDASEHRVRMHDVDDAELERMATDVRKRLVGRRLGRGELTRTVSSAEADLLSQMARRGDVTVVVHRDGSVEIREGATPRGRTASVAIVVKPRRQRPRNG